MHDCPPEFRGTQGSLVERVSRQNLQGAEAHSRSLSGTTTDSEHFCSITLQRARQAFMRKTFGQFLLDKILQVF